MTDKAFMIESAGDAEYRSKSTGYMFRAALFGSLSFASFLGVLGNLLGSALKQFSTEAATTVTTAAANTVTTAPATTTGLLGITPMGWLVSGALMAFGVACTYMSQVESTKLKELQDDHLAQKNAAALCLSQGQGVVKINEVEYPQNCRSDNKPWEEVVATQPEPAKGTPQILH